MKLTFAALALLAALPVAAQTPATPKPDARSELQAAPAKPGAKAAPKASRDAPKTASADASKKAKKKKAKKKPAPKPALA